MNTWAAIEYGKVDTVGLCHGVQHGAEQIAEVLGAERRANSTTSAPASTTRPGSSTCACAAGRSGRTSWSRPSRRHPVYSRQEKVRIDVLKRFGVYSTESNGHLSEYLPWYRKRPDEIARWIDMSNWIHGETGGYLRHSTETPQLVRDGVSAIPRSGLASRIDPASRSNEHASQSWRRWRPAGSIAATSTSRTMASSPTCPPMRSSRSPGFVDRFGINMAAGITLPEACAATCIVVDQRSAHVGACGHFAATSIC